MPTNTTAHPPFFPPPPAGPPPPPPPPPAAAPPPAASPPPAGGPDRSRAGATWVTATGAFLLLVAAAVFVAVQWDHIPDAVKLGILGVLTGGFLLAGRRLRPVLPATGGVLYHLGAFLLPITSAAVVVKSDAGWPVMLLVEGLVASVGFPLLNRSEHSVVLDWATVVGVVVLAAGIGATTPVPMSLALVAFAGVAEWRRRHGAAVAWALVAGLGPMVTAAGYALVRASAPSGPAHLSGALRVLDLLGLTSSGPGSAASVTPLGATGVQVAAAVVGIGAGVVLARNAQRLRRLELVVAAGLSVLVGLVDGWTSLRLSGSVDLIGMGALFLLIELGAWAVADDPFWARPARAGAAITEAVLAVVTATAALAGVAAIVPNPIVRTGLDPALLVAAALVVVAWLVADLRRRQPDRTPPGIALLVGGGWLPGTVAATVAGLAGVALGTGSAPAVGVTAVVIAALLVVSGRPGGHTLAVLIAVPAPLLAGDHPVLATALALVATLTLSAAAVLRSRIVRDEVQAQAVWLLAVSATLPVATAITACAPRLASVRVSPPPTGPTTVAALLAVAVLWTSALVLDRAGRPATTSRTSDAGGDAGAGASLEEIGLVPRAASALTLVAAPLLGPGGVALVAGLLLVLTLLDAGLRRRWWMAVPSGLLACVAAGAAALAADATFGQAALSVLAVGVVATVLDAVAAVRLGRAWPSPWSIPLWCTQGTAAVGSALLASGDRGALATVLIVSGAVIVGYGVRLRRSEILALGGSVSTVGIWLHLIDHHVVATEPYLAPVAAALVIAGWQARRAAPVSSWVAYGPAVVLLGGAALVERLHGGGPAHALVAGTVGLLAVVAGGRDRLIAPLVLGTGLLVALTVNESLAVTAGVPTWGWLALGGSILLAAGIAMEPAETSPIETGRRVVDAVSERFS